MNYKLERVLNKLSPDNLEKNYKLLSRKFYIWDILEELVKDNYNEGQVLLAIHSILKNDYVRSKLNSIEFKNDKNFLFYSLQNPLRHSSEFYLILFEISIKAGLDINATNKEGNTVFHELLKIDRLSLYTDKIIIPIYDMLIENDYDLFVLNNKYQSITDLITSKKITNVNNELIMKIDNDKKRLLSKRIEEEKKRIHVMIVDYENAKGDIANLMRLLYREIPCYKVDEEIRLKLLEYIFSLKLININFSNNYTDNFINHVINENYSKDYIYKLLKLSINYGLDVNHINKNDMDYMYHIIVNNLNKGKITPIFKLLVENGYKGRFLNDNNYRLDKLAESCRESISDYNTFLTKYKLYLLLNKDTKVNNLKDAKDIELNYNIPEDFFYNNNKNFTLILGKEKSGKTYILNNVKNFIDKEYDEKTNYTNISSIISECKTIGSLNITLLKIMKDCVTNNKVLIIDDLDKLYRANITDEEKEEIDILLFYYVNHSNLKLIASININNIEIFKDSILTNSINYCNIKEPSEQELTEIIDKLLDKNLKFCLLQNEYNFSALLKDLLNKEIEFILSDEMINNLNEVSKINIILEIIDSINEYIEKVYNSKDEIIYKENLMEALKYAINKCYNEGFIKKEKKQEIINNLNLPNNKFKYSRILKKYDKK